MKIVAEKDRVVSTKTDVVWCLEYIWNPGHLLYDSNWWVRDKGNQWRNDARTK